MKAINSVLLPISAQLPRRKGCEPKAEAFGDFQWAPRVPTSGFTLIELLVVVSVIGILASLLLPTLSRSKGAAQRIQCVHQLRQMGIASFLYWDDNGGKAFRYRGIATNGGDIYWFGWLERGRERERNFDPSLGALHPYLQGRGVELCPSLNYTLRNFKFKAKGAAYGYGYNLFLSSALHEPAVNIEKVKRPDRLVMLADAAQVNTFQPPASPENPMLEEFYYISTNEMTVHFRHSERANNLFCDGHVDQESPLPGRLDTRIPGQTIGQLPVERLGER